MIQKLTPTEILEFAIKTSNPIPSMMNGNTIPSTIPKLPEVQKLVTNVSNPLSTPMGQVSQKSPIVPKFQNTPAVPKITEITHAINTQMGNSSPKSVSIPQITGNDIIPVKFRSNTNTILIVGGVLLAIGIGYAVYYHTSKKKANDFGG